MKFHNQNPAKVAALEQAALDLSGYPEIRCQIAMGELYARAGWLPADLHIPTGSRDWAKTQGRSLIAEWVDTSGLFAAVPIELIEVGDLLGFRLGHTLHHVAVQLQGGRMAHVFGVHGLQLAPCIPSPWVKRLARAWRPLAIEGGLQP